MGGSLASSVAVGSGLHLDAFFVTTVSTESPVGPRSLAETKASFTRSAVASTQVDMPRGLRCELLVLALELVVQQRLDERLAQAVTLTRTRS